MREPRELEGIVKPASFALIGAYRWGCKAANYRHSAKAQGRFCCSYRTETVPPEPHCLMPDIVPALDQEILDPPKCPRTADRHHRGEADVLDRAIETAK